VENQSLPAPYFRYSSGLGAPCRLESQAAARLAVIWAVTVSKLMQLPAGVTLTNFNSGFVPPEWTVLQLISPFHGDSLLRLRLSCYVCYFAPRDSAMCSRRFRDNFCIRLHGQSEQRSYSGCLVSGPWEPGLKEKVPVPSVARHDRYRGNVTNGPVQCSQGRIKTVFPFLVSSSAKCLPNMWVKICFVNRRTYIFLLRVIRQISEEVVFACTCVKCAKDASATETRDGLCVALALCHLQMYEHRFFLGCKDM